MSLRLKRETPTLLHFRSTSWLIGLAIAAMGVFLLFLAATGRGEGSDTAAAIGALVFIAGGIWGMTHRHELILDLVGRRYRERRGLAWKASWTEGSLDEIDAVVLTREVRQTSERSYTVFIVSLSFGESRDPLPVHGSQTEREGHAEMERLAGSIGIDAVDRTAEKEIRRTAADLDVAVAEGLERRGVRIEAGQRLPPVPAGSGIEIRESASGATIVLPREGWSARHGVGALFAAVFLLGLYVMLRTALGDAGASIFTLAPVGAAVLVGGLFLGPSLFREVASMASREEIREEGDALVVSSLLLGRRRNERRLPKGSIEDVEVAGDEHAEHVSIGGFRATLRARGVRIRTDDETARIGRGLDDEGRAWLHRACMAMAARSPA